MTKGSDNGYLIKDVSVNIKIKLSTYKSDLSRKLGRNDENQQSPNLVVLNRNIEVISTRSLVL